MKTKILLAGAFLFIAGMVQSASAEMSMHYTNFSSSDATIVDQQNADANNNRHTIQGNGGVYNYESRAGFRALNQTIFFENGNVNLEDTGIACDGGFIVRVTGRDKDGVPFATKDVCITDRGTDGIYRARANIGKQYVEVKNFHN